MKGIVEEVEGDMVVCEEEEVNEFDIEEEVNGAPELVPIAVNGGGVEVETDRAVNGESEVKGDEDSEAPEDELKGEVVGEAEKGADVESNDNSVSYKHVIFLGHPKIIGCRRRTTLETN